MCIWFYGYSPDIFLAKICQSPERKSFAENAGFAQEMGQPETSDYYYVKAEPITAKFSAARSGSTSSGGGSDGKPSRPSSGPRKLIQRATGKGRDYV